MNKKFYSFIFLLMVLIIMIIVINNWFKKEYEIINNAEQKNETSIVKESSLEVNQSFIISDKPLRNKDIPQNESMEKIDNEENIKIIYELPMDNVILAN